MTAGPTLLIIDDHPIFREGMKTLIASSRPYVIAGEASTAKDALKLAMKLKPDMITADLSLPDQNGLILVEELARRLPDTRILVISVHSKPEYIESAFKAGAAGYVDKNAAAENLIHALDALSRGEYYIDGRISTQLVKNMGRRNNGKSVSNARQDDTLTRREQEVMSLLAEGLSAKQIADKLCISESTVKNHRANIYRKLDCDNVIDLLKHAVRIGLIDPDMWK